MSGPSLLDLPVEIRLHIYQTYFSSSIVRIRPDAEPSSPTCSALSLLYQCKRIREESLPFLYEHALFWVDSIAALVCMINHHTIEQLQSIRHLAVRNSLVPLPHPKTPWTGVRIAPFTSITQQFLFEAFYEQILPNLRTLVLFNPTSGDQHRMIFEQQAGRFLTDDEFEKQCFDRMHLKVHLFIPVLEKQKVIKEPYRLNSSEDFIPFRIMLRFSRSDGKHRMALYNPKKKSQQTPITLGTNDPGFWYHFA